MVSQRWLVSEAWWLMLMRVVSWCLLMMVVDGGLRDVCWWGLFMMVVDDGCRWWLLVLTNGGPKPTQSNRSALSWWRMLVMDSHCWLLMLVWLPLHDSQRVIKGWSWLMRKVLWPAVSKPNVTEKFKTLGLAVGTVFTLTENGFYTYKYRCTDIVDDGARLVHTHGVQPTMLVKPLRPPVLTLDVSWHETKKWVETKNKWMIAEAISYWRIPRYKVYSLDERTTPMFVGSLWGDIVATKLDTFVPCFQLVLPTTSSHGKLPPQTCREPQSDTFTGNLLTMWEAKKRWHEPT